MGEPHCDAVGQNALDGRAGKGHQLLLTDVIFSEHSQEVQTYYWSRRVCSQCGERVKLSRLPWWVACAHRPGGREVRDELDCLGFVCEEVLNSGAGVGGSQVRQFADQDVRDDRIEG